jgi:hypothetical protein
MFSILKGATLNFLVQGGQLYWAFHFSKTSVVKLNIFKSSHWFHRWMFYCSRNCSIEALRGAGNGSTLVGNMAHNTKVKGLSPATSTAAGIGREISAMKRLYPILILMCMWKHDPTLIYWWKTLSITIFSEEKLLRNIK